MRTLTTSAGTIAEFDSETLTWYSVDVLLQNLLNTYTEFTQISKPIGPSSGVYQIVLFNRVVDWFKPFKSSDTVVIEEPTTEIKY
jgi:hypothetical protein